MTMLSAIPALPAANIERADTFYRTRPCSAARHVEAANSLPFELEGARFPAPAHRDGGTKKRMPSDETSPGMRGKWKIVSSQGSPGETPSGCQLGCQLGWRRR